MDGSTIKYYRPVVDLCQAMKTSVDVYTATFSMSYEVTTSASHEVIPIASYKVSPSASYEVIPVKTLSIMSRYEVKDSLIVGLSE